MERLMHHGEAIVIQGGSYLMIDKDTDPPGTRPNAACQRSARVFLTKVRHDPGPSRYPCCSLTAADKVAAHIQQIAHRAGPAH